MGLTSDAPPWAPALKRALDVVGASAGLVLLSPLMIAVALAIRLTTPGPALFSQERSGRRGRPFRVYKFRTMTAVLPESPSHPEVSADDPRITPIGQVLRRTGLDELPQLVNVLRGEMSLVGPRPLLAWENALCDPRQARRLIARPGITGLSQVMGRNAIPWADRVEWDLIYLDGAGLGLDLWVLAMTIPTALLGRNAYAPRPDPKAPARAWSSSLRPLAIAEESCS